MKINISEILDSKSALFHSEGIKVYTLASKELKKNKKVHLSFKGIENCSTQFLNASIGKLYVKYPEDIVKELLVVEDFAHIPFFDSKLNDVIDNARHYEEYNHNVTTAAFA